MAEPRDPETRWRVGAYVPFRLAREYPREYGHMARYELLYSGYLDKRAAQDVLWNWRSAMRSGRVQFWLEPEAMTPADVEKFLPLDLRDELAIKIEHESQH